MIGLMAWTDMELRAGIEAGCEHGYRQRNETPACRSSQVRENALFCISTGPTDWRPGQVRNLKAVLGNAFTDMAAWDLIATKLEDGHPVEAVELNHPPGRTGYVMKIDLGQERPVYVKLQLAGKNVIGRSFHYSERPADYSEE